MNRSDRLEAPLTRDGSTSRATGWKDALRGVLDRAAGVSGKVKAVASPLSSNEDLGALRSLVDVD